MNKTHYALIALASIVMTVPAVYAAGFSYSFPVSGDEYPLSVSVGIVIEEDGDKNFWYGFIPTEEFETADVTVMGKRQTVTAEDIRFGDTVFENTRGFEMDPSRIAFKLGSSICVYVSEDYNGDNRPEVKRLVCS